MAKKIYVTLGVPFSPIPMANKMGVHIMDDESEIKIVKKIRKTFADNAENHGWVKGTKFTPSQLFWAIFDKLEDKNPREYSQNIPDHFVDNAPDGYQK